jgi:hypothetical protein
MKLINATRAVAIVLFASSMAAGAADEVTIPGTQPAPRLSVDDIATKACFEAFIAELLPGTTARLRVVMPMKGTGVFESISDSVLKPYAVMDVEMSATSTAGGQLLAKSYCRVNRAAKVLMVQTRVTDKTQLTALSLSDIRLAMTIR